MLESLRGLNREKLFGLLFVLALHGAGLYGLWSYRIIPTPVEAVTLMVNLINPSVPEPPKPPKPEPPKPVKPLLPEPPHEHLVAQVPAVLRNGIDQEATKVEHGLTVLASAGSAAPFVGLYGTVWGIYHALVTVGDR